MKSEKAYFLGIDGGGTKTAYLLTDEQGNTLAALQGAGTSYHQIGMGHLEKELTDYIALCCQLASIPKEYLTGITFALPCYGENSEMDEKLREIAARLAGKSSCYLTNDVEAGWAGSLGLKPGIHIVAGTGSIAMGVDEGGKTARTGGWSEKFSDLGSCHWVGMKVLEGFAKEAEELIPKKELYSVIKEAFVLKNDMDFIRIAEHEILPFRDKTAALQKYMLWAAGAGDNYAIETYRKAAEELFQMISGVSRRLYFKKQPIQVSYSGGLFYAADFVFPVLSELAAASGMQITKPLYSPVEGAVLLAANARGKSFTDCILMKWQNRLD